MLHSATFFFTKFLCSADYTSLLTVCWFCLVASAWNLTSTFLMHTLFPTSVQMHFHVGQHHATLAPCPGYFPLGHFSLIMLAMVSLAVYCQPLSMECWPPESGGLASFRLNSQFLTSKCLFNMENGM